MMHKRYGDLCEIWHRTNGKCHLCHEGVDLYTYGLIGLYGGESATVDHLWPQSFGGDDEPENLRIAHLSCNSRRGTKDPDDVRVEICGRSAEPKSASEEVIHGLSCTVGGAGVGALIGMLSAGPIVDEAGRQRARERVIVGSIVGALGGILLAACTR